MGASQGFRIFLDFFMGISTIFGLFFLIYYGYKVEWTSPLILFAISIFIKGILIAIEVKLFFRIQYIVQYIGFISFIACPILAYRLLVISGLISWKKERANILSEIILKKFIGLEIKKI